MKYNVIGITDDFVKNPHAVLPFFPVVAALAPVRITPRDSGFPLLDLFMKPPGNRGFPDFLRT